MGRRLGLGVKSLRAHHSKQDLHFLEGCRLACFFFAHILPTFHF